MGVGNLLWWSPNIFLPFFVDFCSHFVERLSCWKYQMIHLKREDEKAQWMKFPRFFSDPEIFLIVSAFNVNWIGTPYVLMYPLTYCVVLNQVSSLTPLYRYIPAVINQSNEIWIFKTTQITSSSKFNQRQISLKFLSSFKSTYISTQKFPIHPLLHINLLIF